MRLVVGETCRSSLEKEDASLLAITILPGLSHDSTTNQRHADVDGSAEPQGLSFHAVPASNGVCRLRYYCSIGNGV